MDAKKLCKNLLAKSAPEIISHLMMNPNEIQSIKDAGENSWNVCESILTVCSVIEPLRNTSISADIILNKIYDSEFQGKVLGHLQGILHSREVESEKLSKILKVVLTLNKNFGQKMSDRSSAFLLSSIQELKSKFCLKLEIENDESKDPSELYFRDQAIISNKNFKISPENLQKNVLKGSYSSLDNYLKTHFELLLQDFIAPLRDDFSKILNPNFKNRYKLENLICHGQVELLEIKPGYDKVLASFKVDTRDSNFEWDSNSRLMNGSLLILVLENSETESVSIFGTVAEKMFDKRIDIQFLDSVDFIRVANYFTGKGASSILYESPVYYEAYRHVLACLQQTTSLPFPDVIISANKCKEGPNYLKKNFEWNVAPLFHSDMKQFSNQTCFSSEEVYKILFAKDTIETPKSSPEKLHQDLDQLKDVPGLMVNTSQMEAIQNSLSNKVALIQGPPGTGKSYVGQMLVRLLLANQDRIWTDPKTRRPILVVCFTNRALDSFLESTLQITRKVVRIGSRSKSDRLEAHNLAAVKKWSKDAGMREANLYKAEKKLESDLFECRGEMSRICKELNSRSDATERWDATFRKFEKLSAQLEDVRQLESVYLAQRADVVGLTTSGAAKNRHFVRMLDCKVVIVEEAGQVLESHVLSALTPNCQQLILIGDHQQLRPAVSSFNPGQTFGLDVSLFERLVLNGSPFSRLEEQHRMRPEISKIISQVFYPGLKDHISVEGPHNVRGISKNVFLVSHDKPEEDGGPGKSKINLVESYFLLMLAQHLVQSGNSAKRMTILTAYTGQMLHIIKARDQSFPDLREVLITVIDNYQGEENDIILLSLVRSNDEGKIGFLNTAGRVCVALSRAKVGMYIIGNIEELSKKSKIWLRIKEVLQEDDLIGPTLEISCQFHSTTRHHLSSSTDENNQPVIVCKEICNDVLPRCGHRCDRPCHSVDRNHCDEMRCNHPCQRFCSEGHPCQRACDEVCSPCLWMDSVPRVLACGHMCQVKCPSNRDLTGCQEPVIITLDCGHEKKTFCSSTDKSCEIRCDFVLNCGHDCDVLCCHHDKAEGHNQRCTKPCQRPKLGCKHNYDHPICSKMCYQVCDPCQVPVDTLLPCGHVEVGLACFTDPATFECGKRCGKILACGHTCKYYCHECSKECQPCHVPVLKKLSCGHQVKMACGLAVEDGKCLEKCQQFLARCGHPCQLLCYESCDETICQVRVPGSAGLSSCLHTPLVACNARDQIVESALSEPCQEICGQILEQCGHKCKSKCWLCISGRVHGPCTSSCNRRLLCGHICQSVCGGPCPPCSKRKCLFQSCHHKNCKSKCEDPCSTCKEKCGLSCSHFQPPCTHKCRPSCPRQGCPEPCPNVFPCGHKCPSYCGDVCLKPEQCQACLHPDIEIQERIFALNCEHILIESQMKELLNSRVVGYPLCPKCQEPLPWMPRFASELSARKLKVVEVFDKLFALKSNLAQAKKELGDELKESDPKFKTFVMDRIQDRKNLMSLSEVQMIAAKLKLLQITRDQDNSSFLQYLCDPTAPIGERFVENILTNFGKKDLKKHFQNFVSFSVGSWSVCDEGHLYSSVFDCECDKCNEIKSK